MRILIAEDEKDIAIQYQEYLENFDHQVDITNDGDECLDLYISEMNNVERYAVEDEGKKSPYDAVILDYQMPKLNGLETARQILEINSEQRIIFASAFVESTLVDSIKHLKLIVETLQKPFALKSLLDTLEDKEIYSQLQKLNVNIQNLKELNPTHAQVRDYLEAFKKLGQSQIS